REVSTWIMHQMLQHVASGGRGLTLPPVILVGPPGIGKSHYARKLAELAGLPVRMIDVGAGSAGFRISGTEKGWATAQSGL
ncbi:AAA family ATPase, partial [Thioclava sp. 15-R06ZXC-3]